MAETIRLDGTKIAVTGNESMGADGGRWVA
jgi:hypothetical protein